MLTAEQLIAAQKANVETLFGLTNKAFEGVEKLVELNLQVAKTALGEAGDTARAALSVKDAQELLSLQASLLQPSAEKAAAYSRHVYDIAATTNRSGRAGVVHERTEWQNGRKHSRERNRPGIERQIGRKVQARIAEDVGHRAGR